MSLFATSIAAVQQPGFFPIEQATPTLIDSISNGFVGLVMQSEWGPVKAFYTPLSSSDMIATYFPAGSAHTSTGYYATMRRKSVPWCMVRILGGSQGLLPPLITTITQGGTPGATSYSYAVTANNAAGETIGSQVVTTTTGNATLNGTNFNTINWSSVVGATTYNVYRTASSGTPSSTGKVGTAIAGTTFNDTGIAGGSALPTANTTGYTQAVCYLLDSSNVAVAELVALFPGTMPNGGAMTAQVLAASDGIANHFDLVINLTNANTGTTSERYPNLQTQATAILLTSQQTSASRLIASLALINTPVTRPANATYNFQGGSNGIAITATDYNTGFTQLGLVDGVRVVCIDDCGDSIRTATNANLQAHVDLKTDRMAVIQESPNSTFSTVLTNVQSYVDDRVIYAGAFVNVLDDFGNPQLTPFSTFIASAIINLEPQQSHSWWDPRVTTYYNGIASIPATNFSTGDDTVRNQATQAGICLPIRLESGPFAALHDRTTSNVANKRYAVTRRIKDFEAKAIKNAIFTFVNGPNIIDNQRQIKNAIDNYLQSEVLKGRFNSVAPLDIKTSNTVQTAALGQFIMNSTGNTPAPMEEIFLNINWGPSVVVTVS